MSNPNESTGRVARPMTMTGVSRRGFMLATAATFLAGCNSASKSTSKLPEVPWPERGYETPPPSRTTRIDPDVTPPVFDDGALDLPGLISRQAWARGGPNFNEMDRMVPVRYVTVHHDGMSAFMSDSEWAAKQRLELIRSAHRGRGWADIGYHYVVDRGGRVYEARPVTWQGAHVKDHNPGNVGVMALGNFEIQYPTEAQINGVRRVVAALSEKYEVPASRVRTHREWAATACPGRNMHAQVAYLRGRGLLA